MNSIKQNNCAAARSLGLCLSWDAHWSHNNCYPPSGLCALCLDYRHNMTFLHTAACVHVSVVGELTGSILQLIAVR